MCASVSVCAHKQAYTFVWVQMSVYMLHMHIQISVSHVHSAICQMQADVSHMPNLEQWPALTASLINLMDSWLTQDEFIRWLHFTLAF